MEEVIPKLVTEQTNNLLIMFSSEEEIHKAIFSLNRDNATGPNGFDLIFYQTFWKLIKEDVVRATMQFFSKA